ncbi:MAG: hypothetical protein ABIE68_00880 [bacterium]
MGRTPYNLMDKFQFWSAPKHPHELRILEAEFNRLYKHDPVLFKRIARPIESYECNVSSKIDVRSHFCTQLIFRFGEKNRLSVAFPFFREGEYKRPMSVHYKGDITTSNVRSVVNALAENLHHEIEKNKLDQPA